MGRETYTGDVAFEVRGHLGIITLNRPKALNSLTELMCESIRIQLEDWAQDDAVAQVLIRGAGDRGLCAGGDVASLYYEMVELQPRDGGPVLPEGTPAYQAEFAAERFFATEYLMNLRIAEYPKPYIALMDGVVLGGGVGVSAHGSHRIVTERSRIGMPETTIGFAPDVGGTYLLSRAPGQLGVHAGLTGAHLSGADALHLGLADTYVPSGGLEQLVGELTTAPVEEVLPRFAEHPEPSELAEAGWIDQAYTQEDVSGVVQLLEELGQSIPAAAETAKTLRSKSPTMVNVAFQAIRQARELSLEGALSQEYTVAVHALRSHDFREGIRAQLIDKDRNPQWNPVALELVDDDLVAHYFTPVPGKLLNLR
ncbi:enoyl-CoA hydratase/isomerase family protein [Nesterenkonia alkaliphila]|uniref:3-hydroxyisobutyryl-CoA hydrolase n=1 Tax=Nesterenkonia alkaliphila TaxID=1463631 RepID=A0A7K1UHX5_9MICC|nr:enoyl-CoA hydratase/isomerase family protein [Nesterenkonia alkaliphila]MVT26077.1 enoyl-CoA hydratase/isomerase family protein [Nesterenkonia alkaliphila]GFZ79451.1 3-hydroxyisobutyryl-CoA hydrolase [Nesterenkonia alkaliphila]